jgi:hypothetical protein
MQHKIQMGMFGLFEIYVLGGGELISDFLKKNKWFEKHLIFHSFYTNLFYKNKITKQ